MVGKSVNLVSKSLARNLKTCSNKGLFDGDVAEDLSDISDAEVAVYLNDKEEILLKKIAWEMMNPEYQKGTRRKPTAGKKKGPNKKTAPSKKTSAARTESNAASENKKRPSVQINYDVLNELFDAENSPKRAKLEKPVVSDQMAYSEQSREESILNPTQESEEEDEPDWNEDYSNEDAYNHEIEDQDEEEEDNEEII